MTEDRITNITEFVQLICDLAEKTKNEVTLWDAELLYRGQSDASYELLPAIGRDRIGACDCTIFNEERNMIEMAKYKLPELFHRELTPVELLALLQHYGIPTRLLDISENPLVGLYFACKGNEDKDGEVVVFHNKNIDVCTAPIINAIADSYRFANATFKDLSSFYAHVKRQPYFLEQIRTLEVVHENDEMGANWIAKCCEKILYIHAPERSLRQQVQRGRYILFPNHITHEVYENGCFETTMEAIPKDHPDIVKRIIVPKEEKKQILKSLYTLGISEEFLFCDNNDIVCKGIYEYFGKRGNVRPKV